MATKKEKSQKAALVAGIRTKMNEVEFQTLGVSESDGLDYLQELHDKLHVHSLPDEEVAPEEAPVEEAPAEETPAPEVPTEEVPKTDDYDELIQKIGGAKVPPKKVPTEKPFAERKTRKSKKGASDPEATRIEGFILLIAVDTLFPFALAFLNNMLDKKGKRIEPNQLQLDQKSFDKLEPLADQAADYLSFNINPVAGFFIASSLMYANNLIQIKMEK